MIESLPPILGLVVTVASVTTGVLAADRAQYGFRRLQRTLTRRSRR